MARQFLTNVLKPSRAQRWAGFAGVVLLLMAVVPVQAGTLTCTPESGFNVCLRYTNSGADQDFTIPSGVTSMRVKAWGAAAGSSPAANHFCNGGTGGFVAGTLAVTAGTAYKLVVGGAGGMDGTGTQAQTSAYGFGGTTPIGANGSGGGGLSGLFTGSAAVADTDAARALLVAGGGGGCELSTAALSSGGQGGDPTYSGGRSTMRGGDTTSVYPVQPSGTAVTGGGGGGGYSGGVADGLRLTYVGFSSLTSMGEGGSNYVAPALTATSNPSNPGYASPYYPNNALSKYGVGTWTPPNAADVHYDATSRIGQAYATGAGPGQMVVQYYDPNVNYWDGAGPASNGVVNGGTQTWDTTSTRWTRSDGLISGQWPAGQVAIFQGTAGIVDVSGTQSIGGLTFGVDAYTLTSTTGGSLSLDAASNPLTVTNAAQTATVSVPLVGGNGLTKQGAGLLVLGGTNTYSGATVVSAGTLRVNGNQGAATGAASVANGATLGGSGTVGGATTISSGAVLSPGQASGTAAGSDTLTFLGDLTLTAGSAAQFELGSTSSPSTANDLVNVGGNLVLGGTLSVTASADGSFGKGTYRLFNVTGSVSGGFSGVSSCPLGFKCVVDSTSVAGQVNLIVTDLTIRWDGSNTSAGGSSFGGDGGTDQWDSTKTNWTTTTGTPNGPWQAGQVAYFEGAAGTVNVIGTQSIAGLTFTADGYIITGGTGLSGAQANNPITTASGVTATVATTLTGSNGFSKQGAGTLVLSQTSNYTGTTAVNAGALWVNANNGTSTGAVTVSSGATLGGNGTVGGATTINSGGILSPGLASGTAAGSDTLTFSGDLTLASGAVVNMELGSTTTPSTTNDLVVVGGNLNVTSLVLNVTASADGTLGVGTYRLFNVSGTLTFPTAGHTINCPAQFVCTIATVTVGSPKQVNLVVFSGTNRWDGGNFTAGGSTTGGDGGNGTWNGTNTNWTTSLGTPNGAFAAGRDAYFEGAAGTVSVSGNQTVSGLYFSTDQYLLTGSGSLTQAAVVPFVLSATAGTTATVDVPISGTIPVDKQGAGTLVLAAANTYTWNTSVSAGTLWVTGSIAAVGTTGVTVSSGATLGGSGTIASATTINSGGILSPGLTTGTAAGSDTLTFSRAVTLSNGATANFELGSTATPSTANDLVVVGGALTIGTATINISASADGTFGVGTYRLFNVAGALSVTGAVVGSCPSGYVCTLAANGATAPKQVNLVVTYAFNHWDGTSTTAGGSTTGGDGGTSTWNATTTNWTSFNGAVNGAWTGGSIAYFEGVSGTATLAAGYSPSISGMSFDVGGYTVTGGTSLALAAASNPFTVVGSGQLATVVTPIAGNSPKVLEKLGAGNLALTGASPFTGTTTLTAGVLRFNANNNLGTNASTVNFNGGTLHFPHTGAGTALIETRPYTIAAGVQAVIDVDDGAPASNSSLQLASAIAATTGGLVKTGPDTLVLNAANLYSGLTDIRAGALLLGLNAGSATGSIDLSSGVTSTVGPASLVIGRTGTITMAMPITGNLYVQKDAAGTAVFTGTNTYSLNTRINAGTLQISGAGSLGAPVAGVATYAANIITSGGIFDYASSANQVVSGVVGPGSGLVMKTTSATSSLTLTGTNTYTGDTTISAGTLEVAGSGTLGSGTYAGAINNTATLKINSTANQVLSGVISGAAGTLVKANSGSLTLSAANTYTGITSVNAGTLLVTGSTDAASAVSVASGATLGGTGTVAGTVAVSGTLSPGVAGAGTLTTGALTMASGSTSAFQLGAPGTVGGGVNDLLVVQGNLSLSGALNVSALAGFDGNSEYVLFTYTGTLSGAFSSTNLAAAGYNGAVLYDTANKQVKLVAAPRVRVAKVSSGDVGSFVFSMSGLDSARVTLTTVTAGVQVTSATFMGTAGTAATLTETAPADWSTLPVSVSCLDANGATDGNGVGDLGTLLGNQVTLPVAVMVAGADITCIFSNAQNAVTGRVFLDGGAPVVGVNSATPNDGVQNGNESGISGIDVLLTNCGATTHASTRTDGAGAYNLQIAAALQGTAVCVEVGLGRSMGGLVHTATGANANGTVLPHGVATTVGGVAFTYARSGQSVHFVAPTGGSQVLNFGQVAASALQSDRSGTGQPAGMLSYGHSFTAGTAGQLTLTTETTTATPAISGWAETLYLDPTCSGVVQPGASLVSNPIGLVQGQVLCFVMQERVAATASGGATNLVPVAAHWVFANAASISATYRVYDTTTVTAGSVRLQTEVRNVTTSGPWGTSIAARPGEQMEYRVTYVNLGAQPLSVLVIAAGTPGQTTFVSAATDALPPGLLTCSKNTPANPVPAAAVDCLASQAAGGTGLLKWSFTGPLNPGATGAVRYTVQLN